ncbi:MAG: hypothetical protein RMK99_15115 [Anaerolineales bacterium]|nr:hypothetical protein [Anaerolineales bacterium]
MSLTPLQIEAISRQVYGRFPEVKGARPSVQTQSAKSAGAGQRFVLTFKGSGQSAGGRAIQRIVRVITDEHGRILRISTSR